MASEQCKGDELLQFLHKWMDDVDKGKYGQKMNDQKKRR